MKFSEPQYAEVTPELRDRLEKFREEHADDPMGGVGTQVLFEDDRVKIWEMVLEPGDVEAEDTALENPLPSEDAKPVSPRSKLRPVYQRGE